MFSQDFQVFYHHVAGHKIESGFSKGQIIGRGQHKLRDVAMFDQAIKG